MDITSYTFSTEEFERELNNTKDVLLDQLEEDGLLKIAAKDISEGYAITIVRKNRFGSVVRDFLGIKDKEAMYVVVKIAKKQIPAPPP